MKEDNRISPEQMEKVDLLYKSPKERAEEVNSILQRAARELDLDTSLMNITCFSIQWLAMLATGDLSTDEDLVRIAKIANIWLYSRHYNAPEEIYGEPDKKSADK